MRFFYFAAPVSILDTIFSARFLDGPAAGGGEARPIPANLSTLPKRLHCNGFGLDAQFPGIAESVALQVIPAPSDDKRDTLRRRK